MKRHKHFAGNTGWVAVHSAPEYCFMSDPCQSCRFRMDGNAASGPGQVNFWYWTNKLYLTDTVFSTSRYWVTTLIRDSKLMKRDWWSFPTRDLSNRTRVSTWILPDIQTMCVLPPEVRCPLLHSAFALSDVLYFSTWGCSFNRREQIWLYSISVTGYRHGSRIVHPKGWLRVVKVPPKRAAS